MANFVDFVVGFLDVCSYTSAEPPPCRLVILSMQIGMAGLVPASANFVGLACHGAGRGLLFCHYETPLRRRGNLVFYEIARNDKAFISSAGGGYVQENYIGF